MSFRSRRGSLSYEGVRYDNFNDKSSETKPPRPRTTYQFRLGGDLPARPVSLLTELVREVKGEGQPPGRRSIVCFECTRKPRKDPAESFRVFPRPEWEINDCFSSRGALCMGFLTRGGCGAPCPRGGLPCWGCRGPSDVVRGKMAAGTSYEQVVLDSLAHRCRLPLEMIEPAIKLIRSRANSALNFCQNLNCDRRLR